MPSLQRLSVGVILAGCYRSLSLRGRLGGYGDCGVRPFLLRGVAIGCSPHLRLMSLSSSAPLWENGWHMRRVLWLPFCGDGASNEWHLGGRAVELLALFCYPLSGVSCVRSAVPLGITERSTIALNCAMGPQVRGRIWEWAATICRQNR